MWPKKSHLDVAPIVPGVSTASVLGAVVVARRGAQSPRDRRCISPMRCSVCDVKRTPSRVRVNVANALILDAALNTGPSDHSK